MGNIEIGFSWIIVQENNFGVLDILNGTTTSEPDNNVYLKDLSDVVIRYFLDGPYGKIFLGQKFQRQENYYKLPVTSSFINEFQVSSDIKCKAFKLPAYGGRSDDFVTFPLMKE
jgi:hypothetical protein